MKPITLATLALCSVIAAPGLAAQATPSPSGPAAPSGVRGEILAQFNEAATKLIQLAEAIPQEQYAWRPGTGVRSVGEVLMHVAGGNYLILSFAGVKAPDGMTPEGGAPLTDRAQVIARLKASCDHFRAAVRDASDADLAKPTTMFRQATTYRNVYLTTVSHAHEHLGQLIAYARSNGIVPPWSRAGGGQ